MPLSFFYNWLPIDYKINSFARLFKEQYHASVLLAKVIGVGHDCGFIQLLPGKICRLNYEYNNDIYSQILNCFIKTSTKKIDITINNSFKLISKIVAIIYHKVKPDFDSIQNDKLLEVALNIFKKHGIDSAAKENHWFQKNNFTNKQFNFATFIFYFIDYFVTRKNLTLLFGSGSSEIYNYFSIALSLNGLDRVIVQTLISNKKELLHKNIIDLDLHGDNYAIAQDFKSAFEMRNFIHQISSLEISDSEILSLTTWTLQ